MKKKTILAMALLLIVTAAASDACTTILVGKQATADGAMIIARNEDSESAGEPQNMIRTPAGKAAGTFISNSLFNPENNTFTWPLPPNALGYVSFPHWRSEGKQSLSFAETGINDYGVSLSATETIFNSDGALKADPYLARTGVTEDSITTVVLPYATSAREGVRLLGGMIEAAGAGEGFGVAFCDRNEIWYLETASGHHWMAARIPDDASFVSANQGRFQHIHLKDPMNFLAFPGLIEFAAKNGLHDPAKGPFNFFQCYIRNTPHDLTYNHPRVRELMRLFSGAHYDKADGLFPVFMRPSKKLTVEDVKAALRNHYDGTPHDPYLNQNPKEPYRPISVMRTAISHVTQTRGDLPEDLAVVQYIALGMTDLSVYMPFYRGLTIVPAAYQGATGAMDDASMFWRLRRLQVLVLQDYPRFAPEVRGKIAEFEREVAARQADMERHYLRLWQEDRTAARGLIQDLTDQVIRDQERLLNAMIDAIGETLGMKNLTRTQLEELIRETEKRYHFHGA